MSMTARDLLQAYEACEPAVHWAGTRSPEHAWRDCPKPSWLLWAAARVGVDKSMFVEVAVRSARRVLHLIPDDEKRPLLAIQAAEAWLKNPEQWNNPGRPFPVTMYETSAHANECAVCIAGTVPRFAAHAAAEAVEAVMSLHPAIDHARGAVLAASAAMLTAADAHAAGGFSQKINDRATNMIRDVLAWDVISRNLTASAYS